MPTELSKYLKLINQNIETLKNDFGVVQIAIFGSISRGESTKKSDIDIIVKLKKPLSLFSFIELENYLTKILGKKVDLTTKEALKPTIKKNILKEAVYA